MGSFVQQVRILFTRFLTRYSPAFLAWGALAIALAGIVLLLAGKIFFAAHELTVRAVDSGQRVTILVNTGAVEGNIRHTRREETPAPESKGGAAAMPASQIVSKEGLAPAPLASISEQSDKGLIPVAAPDGTLAWKYYARPFASARKRPLIAIVFTNLALSKPLTEEALTLPHNFTLGFSPYASDARNWARDAREAGFESVIDLPMQAQDYPFSDPGPYGLLDNLTSMESTARLHWALSRFTGYVGVLAPADEKLTANLAAFRPILTELTARGLLFIYLKNSQNAGLADLAKSHTVYALAADAVIDADVTPPAINKQLDALVQTAKARGFAIGIAHSYPTTTGALKDWVQGLDTEDVDLAPVSAIAAKQFP